MVVVVVMTMILLLTFPHRGTQSFLVDVGMVLNLLPGMSLVAIFAAGASIEQAPLELGGNIRCTKHLSGRNNIRTHFRRVAEEDWIPAQPTAVDLDVSETTDGRVVLVALGAPRRAELVKIDWSQLSKDIPCERSRSVGGGGPFVIILVMINRSVLLLGHARQ